MRASLPSVHDFGCSIRQSPTEAEIKEQMLQVATFFLDEEFPNRHQLLSLDWNLLKRDGERGRNRTFNLLIKSQLLCQLSYAPSYGKETGEASRRDF